MVQGRLGGLGEAESLGGTWGPAVCTQCVSAFQERLGPGNKGEMGVSERAPLRPFPDTPTLIQVKPGGGVLQGWRRLWPQRTSGPQLPEPDHPQACSWWGAGGPAACVRPGWPAQISLLPSGSQGLMGKGGIRSSLWGTRVVSCPNTGAPAPPPETLGVTCPPWAPREAWRGSCALRPSQALCPRSRDSTVGTGHGQASSTPSGGPSAGHSLWGATKWPEQAGQELGVCAK